MNAKHHAFQPQSRDVMEAMDAALEAFNGIASILLHCNFARVSAMDLIDEGAEKSHLTMAIQAHESKNSFGVASNVRMAIYEMIESKFDVSSFAQTNQTLLPS
ncbi:hypothetical protein [Luteibacter rhizovicinus]|nr:hypothetical protein [Luteibacter rhizovicinus]